MSLWSGGTRQVPSARSVHRQRLPFLATAVADRMQRSLRGLLAIVRPLTQCGRALLARWRCGALVRACRVGLLFAPNLPRPRPDLSQHSSPAHPVSLHGCLPLPHHALHPQAALLHICVGVLQRHHAPVVLAGGAPVELEGSAGPTLHRSGRCSYSGRQDDAGLFGAHTARSVPRQRSRTGQCIVHFDEMGCVALDSFNMP